MGAFLNRQFNPRVGIVNFYFQEEVIELTPVSKVATAVKGLSDSLNTLDYIRCRRSDMLATILIVVVLLMLLGVLPRWSHSRQWGYFPSGGRGLVLVIVIVLVLWGRL
jgi:Protein of unknown function (DUF3309)